MMPTVRLRHARPCTTIAGLLLMATTSSVVAAQRPSRGQRTPASGLSAPGAHYDACKLLQLADVTPIMGDGATEELTQGGQTCTFRSADKKRKLFVRTPESTRTPADVSFKNYRTGPHHNYTIADEKGLGDEAVSAITPMGVEIMALKQNRILYIQDYPGYGSKGTAEMLNQLRPIAKKAADAF
jgi:hypothetical protein